MRLRSVRTWTAVLVSTAVLGVALLCGAAGWWHHQGGRWFAVTSASMGTAMPTGSLLLTRPVAIDDVHTGDVITFRSPGSHSVFSHRVVDRTPAGLTTRGDVNLADDAWTITQGDLIGKVAWHGQGLGWLLRGLPLLFLGLAVTWLVSLVASASSRYGWRMVGTSLTVAVVSWLLRPWVGLQQLAVAAPDDGSTGMLMEVISTGLLPIRAFEVDGDAQARLVNGETDVLHLTRLSGSRYDLDARLDLAWWGWLALALVVLAPLLWSLVRGLPPQPEPDQVSHRGRNLRVRFDGMRR